MVRLLDQKQFYKPLLANHHRRGYGLPIQCIEGQNVANPVSSVADLLVFVLTHQLNALCHLARLRSLFMPYSSAYFSTHGKRSNLKFRRLTLLAPLSRIIHSCPRQGIERQPKGPACPNRGLHVSFKPKHYVWLSKYVSIANQSNPQRWYCIFVQASRGHFCMRTGRRQRRLGLLARPLSALILSTFTFSWPLRHYSLLIELADGVLPRFLIKLVQETTQELGPMKMRKEEFIECANWDNIAALFL
jgi:hypothetical protein